MADVFQELGVGVLQFVDSHFILCGCGGELVAVVLARGSFRNWRLSGIGGIHSGQGSARWT